jgi:DNA-binding transcriptional ArsR family regulator
MYAIIIEIIIIIKNNMKKAVKTKLDLVTHPVRLRILMALAGVERTAYQIAATMSDIPTSSIYRHLQKLLDAGIVEVTAERQVRGAVEKTLRIVSEAAEVEQSDAEQWSLDAQRRAFMVFFTQLFHEFDTYLQRPNLDPVRDLVGFRTGVFHASDEEWLAAIQAMNAVLLPLLENKPTTERKLRRFATVSLLAPDEQVKD